MATRRHFLTFSGLFAAGAALTRAEDLCSVATKETQAATTADQALSRLKAGNERFRTGRSLHCDLVGQITDGDFHAAAEVHGFGLVVAFGGEDNALRRVVHVEELARSRAIAP